MKALLALVLVLFTANVCADIGAVSDSSGTPGEITRGNSKLTGTRGASIESNDIYTTKNGSVHLAFKDDTKVKITENSRLLIDDFVYDPKKSDAGKLALKVGMGTVRYASGQIAKTNAQQVAIKTPTATIAVRGTDFTMTVDEAGQSLVVLVPSCKEDEKIKDYELEENKCRVGSITVETLAGTVVLDRAFEATFVTSNSMPPTQPSVINTVEAKISNNLILVRPLEITKAVNKQSGKTQKEKEQEEAEQDQVFRMNERIAKERDDIERARLLALAKYLDRAVCNPYKTICVNWDKPEATDGPTKGKGVAYRITDNAHYAEVKTQGYSSNTLVTINQNDVTATELIGSGDPGGNIVNIKQISGVLRKP
jgi:hypothetical protein